MAPERRTAVKRCVNRWASEIVSGINSGVSSHAKPTMVPWSPAPWRSCGSPVLSSSRTSQEVATPSAMSPDCRLRETITPQVSASKP